MTTTNGSIENNDSDVAQIARMELTADPAALADRWQDYYKSGGLYVRTPTAGAGVPRLLTSADLSSLEAHDADLTIIAALAATTGNFIVSRAGAWASDTLQAADIPDIGATYVKVSTIGSVVQAYAADLAVLSGFGSAKGIPKRTGAGTWAMIGGELFLSAAGGTPSLTNGCAPSAKWETPTNKQDVWSLDYDASAIEYAQWLVWMPASWDGGTVTFAVQWTAASGSGDVVFTLDARAYANDDALDQAFGTGIDVTDTLTAVLDVDISPASTAVTIAGSPAAGNPVLFRLSRKATAGGDTLAVDARVLGVKIFYGAA